MENYFYLNEKNEQKGPVSPEELISNGVTKNTLVWKNGMAQWLPAGEVSELANLFTDTPPTPKPENWLIWAILSTVLCCLPLGVVSIIYATKVDNLWNSGQQEEAIKASNMARLFFFLALGGGVLALIIGFISGLASMMFGGGYY
ncbi:CD225/dispanin family protein [Butyricimonas faecalis]|nr:CD225/dispanin family protein [Butyricimonas faecalis]